MGRSENLEDIRAHERVWQTIYENTGRALEPLGRNGYHDGADYWIVDDDWGWNVLQVEFQNLDLLRPDVVKLLQSCLINYPAWMITLRIDLRDASDIPGMGLVIYPDRISDDLRREFLPARFDQVRFD